MKINPWIVVSLLVLACGFLLGSRVENEAEAEAPKYQYFYSPKGAGPRALGIESVRGKPIESDTKGFMYTRVDLKTGRYEALHFSMRLDKPASYHWVPIHPPELFRD